MKNTRQAYDLKDAIERSCMFWLFAGLSIVWKILPVWTLFLENLRKMLSLKFLMLSFRLDIGCIKNLGTEPARIINPWIAKMETCQ